jgi:hypothetical protein
VTLTLTLTLTGRGLTVRRRRSRRWSGVANLGGRSGVAYAGARR